jgi:hypothetical protein
MGDTLAIQYGGSAAHNKVYHCISFENISLPKRTHNAVFISCLTASTLNLWHLDTISFLTASTLNLWHLDT